MDAKEARRGELRAFGRFTAMRTCLSGFPKVPNPTAPSLDICVYIYMYVVCIYICDMPTLGQTVHE